mmetsp:Transcript_25208/g.24976  ORF Transcript_25208/g.24976 Transcript_25208/m.24976 type:complete len:208 (+) Transcript_25208:824-1447(+)
MVCAMLLDIQNIVSRPFRKLVDSADKALFNGPPEQTRDYVIYAFRSLYHGEWKKAIEYLFSASKVWKLIPEEDRVKNFLVKEVKEVALKILMFRNSSSYESYSISDLGNLFELTEEEVHRIVSKIIIRERCDVSIKKEENVVQINETPKSDTQTFIDILVDKVRSVSDYNNKILRGSSRQNRDRTESDSHTKPKEEPNENGEENIVT